MNQTKLESLLESILNVGSGIITALIVWMVIIVPIFRFEVTFVDNILITLTFTFISIIRGYLWRRFFNAGIHKAVHNFVRKVFT